MSGSRILSLASCLFIAVLFGCTDDNIEGAAKVTSNVFSLGKTSSSFTTLNSSSCFTGTGSTRKPGTEFVVTIEYQGAETVTNFSYVRTFSGGTGGTDAVVGSENDNPNSGSSGGLGTFRGATSSGGTPTLKIEYCVVFAAATSVKYDITVITTTNSITKTYNTTTTINKPTGAN